ncbi:MAG: hypothetical protein ABIM88_07680 [candidate division WOR-3 bacterium]
MFGFYIIFLLDLSEFAMAYGGPGSDYAYSLIRTGDRGFALVGATYSGGAGGADLLVIRLDSIGNIVWAKAYGGPGNDLGYSVAEMPDGGLAIVGETRSFGSGGLDILVIRTDPTGNILWARTYGGPLDDQAQSVIVTADSGFAITGISRSYGAGNGDCILLRLNSNGALSWARAYGGSGLDLGASIIESSDGGFLVAGYAFVGGLDEQADIMVIKTNSSGGVSWARLYGGPSSDYARGASETSSGDFIVAGSTYSFGSGEYDFMVMKINPSGSIIWARSFGDLDMDYAQGVVSTPEGGCVVVGQTQNYGAGLNDFMFLRLDSYGSLFWARTFGGPNADYPKAIVPTSDGGFAIAGYSYSFGAGAYDAVVLRLDSLGQYENCTMDCQPNMSIPSPSFSVISTGATVNPSASSPSLTVTPISLSTTVVCRPFYIWEEGTAEGRLIFSYPVSGGAGFVSSTEAIIRVFSVDGKLVYCGKLMKGENRICLGTGVYLWMAELLSETEGSNRTISSRLVVH